MTTIIDVAKAANVSPSTVSRVIADHPRISVKTKRKVRQVMEELSYYPNVQARNLAAKKTQMIGIVMGYSAMFAFQNPFFPEVIRGISATAYANKYGIALSTSNTEEELLEEIISMVQSKRVDGLILLYAKENDPLVDYLLKKKFPFVVVGTPDKDQDLIDFIDNDNVALAENLVDYLVSLGHEQIAFVGGNIQYGVTRDRVKGYEESHKKHGLPINKKYFQYGVDNYEELLKNILVLKNRPTAILTQDDLIAYELITLLEQWEISVPEDISVISINNHPVSGLMRPALTTVEIHIFELGRKAAELLCQRIEHPEIPAQHAYVDTELIIRQSCAKR